MLLSLTRIYSLHEDNSLILIDEPENHLQPPMLSTLLDALSFICNSKNCISLIATHSPVTVQELDKDNVLIMDRDKDGNISINHAEENTFGENIGKLNRKIFNYELSKSGYYKKIEKFIHSLRNDQLRNEFYKHLGLEGRMLMDSKEISNEFKND